MPLYEWAKTWWGPPKKFSAEIEERKVSWLELFYDLVYVIAIASITHHLAGHLSFHALLDYVYFFMIIFWGWLNGSLYHDLHGSSGLRTRLMTLWQMMIVAALVITINSNPENMLFNVTITVLVMQLFITYLWWSVGIYEKYHRRLNKPYTIFYLSSFALMFVSLFADAIYARALLYLALVCNYIPPFVTNRLIKRESLELSLSPSMSERLGLFTIIIFGEVVLGVVNGVSDLQELNFAVWVNFGLAVCIVFSLWWIFFTLVSDRDCKRGFVNSSLLEILYIPTLMSLGCIGVGFSGLFESYDHHDMHTNWLKNIFGYSLSLFFAGVSFMLFFLEYPPGYRRFKGTVRQVLLLAAFLLLIITLANPALPLFYYLLTIFIVLLSVIIVLNQLWYKIKIRIDNGQTPGALEA